MAIASIVKPPQDATLLDPVAFWLPFDLIASRNREICVGLTAAVLLLIARLPRPPATIYPLIALQTLIFLKNFSATPEAAIAIYVGFLLMLISICAVAQEALRRNESAESTFLPVLVGSVVFLAANIVQFGVNPAATMVVGGRFHGITSNPLMFSLCLAVVVPTLCFFLHTRSRFSWAVTILFPIIFYFVMLSGSRLGLLILCSAIGAFYLKRPTLALKLVMFGAVMLVLVVSLSDVQVLDANSRIYSSENTRADAWSLQLDAFYADPIWGAPVETGSRVTFGESSYLASAVAVGISGPILIGWFAISLLRILVKLRSYPYDPSRALALAIIASLILGSVFEAVFFGVFTLPIMALVYVLGVLAKRHTRRRFVPLSSKRLDRLGQRK